MLNCTFTDLSASGSGVPRLLCLLCLLCQLCLLCLLFALLQLIDYMSPIMAYKCGYLV